MGVCLGYEWKNKEWLILWIFNMCMFVFLCTTQAKLGGKKICNGSKMTKLDRRMCQLLSCCGEIL